MNEWTPKFRKAPKVRAVAQHFAQRQRTAHLTKRIMAWHAECMRLLEERGVPDASNKAMDLFARNCRTVGVHQWPEPADVVASMEVKAS